MKIRLRLLLPAVAVAAAVVCGSARADGPKTSLVIRNQQFIPPVVNIPAQTKIEIVVRNEDRMPAEFESYDLSREIVVPGLSAVSVYVGPLPAGRYRFFNDFNHAASGWVVSVPDPKSR